MENKSTNLKYTFAKKRQWGAEKRMEPLPMLHEVPSTAKLSFSRLSIILTVFFWVLYIFSIIIKQLIDGPQNYSFTMDAFSYSVVVSILTFSSLMYLIARHGALDRFSKFSRTPKALLDDYFSKDKPGITVLVPSYAEEYSVIRKTLLSAALQEYPNLKIVLLIDDKPNPTDPEVLEKLNQTRNIGVYIQQLFSEPYRKFKRASDRFDKIYEEKNKTVSASEIRTLALNYKWAADWLNNMADEEEMNDHVDVFFSEQVIKGLANDLTLVANALTKSYEEKGYLPKNRLQQLYQKLVWIFKTDVSTFERKKYASLSHEPNKAMNLNAYIGLMGGIYREEVTPNGTFLVTAKRNDSNTVEIPDSEFLLTLDADSILLREYCLRLVYLMKQPENSKIAVAQTPYSSFRGAFTRIERLAGATTDIQHILHQGKSRFGATFWVGANAVIRKIALKDIVEKEWTNGVEVNRFIQDRTVIEDTESSIDLTYHGWQLMNYPERLSYSATPPDFGSLVVQRRRWANGGLLILPKLISQLKERRIKNDPVSRTEFLLRLNYMASIAWSTFGLIFLLAYPYDGRLLSPLVILAAMPYFISYAYDLKYCGYNYSDIFRIYGFNLIMLPVNLAGVVKSIEQAITGKKIPFARTPKVKDRTPASPEYVIAPFFIVGFSIFTVWRNILIPNWGNAIFAAFNALAASWAIVSYIGITNALIDIWLGFTNWLYVEEKPNKIVNQHESLTHDLDWKTILYEGNYQVSGSGRVDDKFAVEIIK